MNIAEKIKLAGVEPLNIAAHPNAVPLVVADLGAGDDEKYWMKLTDTVWSRPLVIYAHSGGWIECFRVTGNGLVNRHRHATPVFVYCIEGSFGYLEHDFMLGPGGVLYEPVGETHTFCCFDENGAKAIAVMFGPLVLVDETGKDMATITGLDVLDKYREHCESVGLGKSFAEGLIR
jgi:2,4'-dihydroxyacetophenone dioxygenase